MRLPSTLAQFASVSVVVLLLGFQCVCAVGADTKRPNVLIIFTDDLDFDELSAFNPLAYPTATAARALSDKTAKAKSRSRPMTPQIDRLVSEGMTFTQMRMVTAVCTPARYALLTGQHCSRSLSLQKKHPTSGPACVEFNTDILPGQWHLARGLHDAGYVTGIAGKWHLSDPRASPGFIRPPICDYQGKENGSQDPTDPQVAMRVREAYTAGIKYLTEQEGFDYASSIYMCNANQLGLPKPLWKHENNMEWCTAGAVKFLEQNKNHPFMLYFAPNIPHGGGGTRFAKADPRATPEGLVDWHLGIQPTRQDVLRRLKDAQMGTGLAWATWLDDGIGVILKKLNDLGLADNTIVIFSSDQQSRGKWTCYEGVRVPFVVRWPGHVRAGSHCDVSLASVDIAPTLLELCGGHLPTKEQAIVDGRSFAPCLSGGVVAERPVLIEMGYGRAVVSDGWKYIAIRYPPSVEQRARNRKPGPLALIGNKPAGVEASAFPAFADRDQLFNLKDDPLEQRNLANDPALADKLKEMKHKLSECLAPLPHSFGEFTSARTTQ